MLTVETIRKIRLAIHRDGKSIRQTAKELRLSRNTVRKALRSQQTAFEYRRRRQPRPALGRYIEGLEEDLAKDQNLPRRQRRTAMALFEQLQGGGYTGSYDSIRRHVRQWREHHRSNSSEVYIPLIFDPGEAFQFDWSHEQVEMCGMPMMGQFSMPIDIPHNTHSTVEEVLRKKAGCDLESRSRFYQKSRKLAKCGLIYGNEEGVFSATPSLTLIVIRTRSLLHGREMGRL